MRSKGLIWLWVCCVTRQVLFVVCLVLTAFKLWIWKGQIPKSNWSWWVVVGILNWQISELQIWKNAAGKSEADVGGLPLKFKLIFNLLFVGIWESFWSRLETVDSSAPAAPNIKTTRFFVHIKSPPHLIYTLEVFQRHERTLFGSFCSGGRIERILETLSLMVNYDSLPTGLACIRNTNIPMEDQCCFPHER